MDGCSHPPVNVLVSSLCRFMALGPLSRPIIQAPSVFTCLRICVCSQTYFTPLDTLHYIASLSRQATSMTSTKDTLVGEEKPEQKASLMMLDPGTEQSDLEQAAGSTGTPSTALDFEDEKKNGVIASTDDMKGDVEIPAQDQATEEDYPTGIRLFFIVVALVISMFLLSIDMVSATSSETAVNIITNSNRPSWLQLFPGLPTNSTVSTKSPGMDPPSSCV